MQRYRLYTIETEIIEIEGERRAESREQRAESREQRAESREQRERRIHGFRIWKSSHIGLTTVDQPASFPSRHPYLVGQPHWHVIVILVGWQTCEGWLQPQGALHLSNMADVSLSAWLCVCVYVRAREATPEPEPEPEPELFGLRLG